MDYAVIKTGGKQYRVSPGDLLTVEKLDGEPGAECHVHRGLMAATLGGPSGRRADRWRARA